MTFESDRRELISAMGSVEGYCDGACRGLETCRQLVGVTSAIVNGDCRDVWTVWYWVGVTGSKAQSHNM